MKVDVEVCVLNTGYRCTKYFVTGSKIGIGKRLLGALGKIMWFKCVEVVRKLKRGSIQNP